MGEGVGAILLLGLLLVFGLGAGLLAQRFGLPRVAAYILAGIVFSKDVLGERLGLAVGPWAEMFTSAALGIIAYLIGGSITVAQTRRLGKVILCSAAAESLGAVLVVFLCILALGPHVGTIPPMRLALALAAIAATTAPAATIAVLHQYRARGPLTTTLLGVVAIDDALGVLFFSLMLVATVGASLGDTLGSAALSIGGAVLVGAAAGGGLALAGPRIRRVSLRLPLVLGTILLVVGAAEAWALSPLLAAMATGFCARSFSRAGADRLFLPVEFLEEVVLLVFFTLAGAHFEGAVFLDHVALIATYFVARIAGKVLGAATGARLAGAPEPVVRWLGAALVPQAGVAVGLVLTLSQTAAFADGARAVVNIILGTTVLYELVGPLATRLALARAGELGTRRERRRA